jgi:hypothetical protein
MYAEMRTTITRHYTTACTLGRMQRPQALSISNMLCVSTVDFWQVRKAQYEAPEEAAT